MTQICKENSGEREISNKSLSRKKKRSKEVLRSKRGEQRTTKEDNGG